MSAVEEPAVGRTLLLLLDLAGNHPCGQCSLCSQRKLMAGSDVTAMKGMCSGSSCVRPGVPEQQWSVNIRGGRAALAQRRPECCWFAGAPAVDAALS